MKFTASFSLLHQGIIEEARGQTRKIKALA